MRRFTPAVFVVMAAIAVIGDAHADPEGIPSSSLLTEIEPVADRRNDGVLYFHNSTVRRSREADGVGFHIGSGAPPPPKGYGAPSNPSASYSTSSPPIHVVVGPSGGQCRAVTKYILTWTRMHMMTTHYDTRSEYLPTTLYKYVTEKQHYPVTAVKLLTKTAHRRPEHHAQTKISYKTHTMVLPQVVRVTSTLVMTEDEHITKTETDHLTKTRVQQIPLSVTSTRVIILPKVQTAVKTQVEHIIQTTYATKHHKVTQTETKTIRPVQHITTTSTYVKAITVAVTKTQNKYHTVEYCDTAKEASYTAASEVDPVQAPAYSDQTATQDAEGDEYIEEQTYPVEVEAYQQEEVYPVEPVQQRPRQRRPNRPQKRPQKKRPRKRPQPVRRPQRGNQRHRPHRNRG